MSDDAQKLLMMFIRDSYQGSGKPRKETLLAMMTLVGGSKELQRLVNIGYSSKILEYRFN